MQCYLALSLLTFQNGRICYYLTRVIQWYPTEYGKWGGILCYYHRRSEKIKTLFTSFTYKFGETTLLECCVHDAAASVDSFVHFVKQCSTLFEYKMKPIATFRSFSVIFFVFHVSIGITTARQSRRTILYLKKRVWKKERENGTSKIFCNNSHFTIDHFSYGQFSCTRASSNTTFHNNRSLSFHI